jgi:hypothetical protein
VSIRSQIESHQGLVVRSDQDGNVIVPQADFLELIELAHAAIHPESTPGQIPNDHISREQRLMDAIWSDPEEDGPEQPDESPEYDRGYDQAREDRHRELALAYAANHTTTQIQAAHGLDSTPVLNTVEIAQAFYDFLNGK